MDLHLALYESDLLYLFIPNSSISLPSTLPLVVVLYYRALVKPRAESGDSPGVDRSWTAPGQSEVHVVAEFPVIEPWLPPSANPRGLDQSEGRDSMRPGPWLHRNLIESSSLRSTTCTCTCRTTNATARFTADCWHNGTATDTDLLW